MKRKFEISCDTGFENESGPVRETIKSFKNEPDALRFYLDPRNTRRYGTMYLEMRNEHGNTYEWDDSVEMWREVKSDNNTTA